MLRRVANTAAQRSDQTQPAWEFGLILQVLKHGRKWTTLEVNWFNESHDYERARGNFYHGHGPMVEIVDIRTSTYDLQGAPVLRRYTQHNYDDARQSETVDRWYKTLGTAEAYALWPGIKLIWPASWPRC